MKSHALSFTCIYETGCRRLCCLFQLVKSSGLHRLAKPHRKLIARATAVRPNHSAYKYHHHYNQCTQLHGCCSTSPSLTSTQSLSLHCLIIPISDQFPIAPHLSRSTSVVSDLQKADGFVFKDVCFGAYWVGHMAELGSRASDVMAKSELLLDVHTLLKMSSYWQVTAG